MKPLPWISWEYHKDGRIITRNGSSGEIIIRQGEPIVEPFSPREKLPLKKLTCLRCNVSWIPRKKQPPVQCPKCRSPYWNRARKH